MSICEYCGEPFEKTNANQKYCCTEHRFLNQEKVKLERVRERLQRIAMQEKYSKDYKNFAVYYHVNIAPNWRTVDRPYPCNQR